MKDLGRGTIYKITQGLYKGIYCVAYRKQQIEHYIKQKRMFIHLFTDKECTKPLLNEEQKKLCTIYFQKDMEKIGYLKKVKK